MSRIYLLQLLLNLLVNFIFDILSKINYKEVTFMHKKLKKYIDSYEIIDSSSLKNTSYKLTSNGGMKVIINLEDTFEVTIKEQIHPLITSQCILVNVYENPIYLKCNEQTNLVVVNFKGAGASFFFDSLMDDVYKNIVILNENIIPPKSEFKNKEISTLLDNYFVEHFKPSNLPFNIMNIIALVHQKNGDYDIDEILACANIPRRIFDKIFFRQAGISFKSYTKIIKTIY